MERDTEEEEYLLLHLHILFAEQYKKAARKAVDYTATIV